MGLKIVLFHASLSSLRTTLWLRLSSSRARSYALTPSSPARAPRPREGRLQCEGQVGSFLKEVYGRAKEADKFLMSQQSALKTLWNTMVASSFRGMRLSIACAATDAEYQNRIIFHDNTLNLPVVARQPHPNPNYAPHMAARRVAAF